MNAGAVSDSTFGLAVRHVRPPLCAAKKCADRVEAQVTPAYPTFIFEIFVCRSGQNICPSMSEDMPKKLFEYTYSRLFAVGFA